MKEIPFFVWNALTTPDGMYYSLKNEEELTHFITLINNQLSHDRELTVDWNFIESLHFSLNKTEKSPFQQYERNREEKERERHQLSAFQPIHDLSLFSVVTSSSSSN